MYFTVRLLYTGTVMIDPGQIRQVVENGGGKFVGIQNNYGIRPDDVIFQPYDHGTSIHLPLEGLTSEMVWAMINIKKTEEKI